VPTQESSLQRDRSPGVTLLKLDRRPLLSGNGFAKRFDVGGFEIRENACPGVTVIESCWLLLALSPDGRYPTLCSIQTARAGGLH
jgi:hypothetical protein